MMPSTPSGRDVQRKLPVGLNITLSPTAALSAVEDLRVEAGEHMSTAGEQIDMMGEQMAKADEGMDAVASWMDKAGEQADVRQTLRMAAITVLTHEMFSEHHHSRVSNEQNLLPLLLCLLHGHNVADATQVLRWTKLGKGPLLPLAFWDSLYLALIAEIRILHHDLLRDLSASPKGDQTTLHNFGCDGTEVNTPFLTIDFAIQLETIWSLLMEELLLGPLEKAVRLERLRQEYRANTHNSSNHQSFPEWWNNHETSTQLEFLAASEGVIDATTLSPTAIVEIVRESHIPLIRMACEEQTDNRRSLSEPPSASQSTRLAEIQTHHASQHATGQERPSSGHSEDFPDLHASAYEPHCFCDEYCLCRPACQYEIHRCECKGTPQPSLQAINHYEPVSHQQNVGANPQQHQAVAGISDRMANMHMAAMPVPQNSPTSGVVHTAPRADPEAMARPARQRSNTAQSNLVYVPEVPTSPVPYIKDAVPLAFYGRNSGHRYPTFTRNNSFQPSPGHTPGGSQVNVPSRRPVPSPLTAGAGLLPGAGAMGESQYFTPSSSMEAQIPSSNIRSYVRNFAFPPGQAATSSTPYTQSFPVPSHGNYRAAEHEFDNSDTSHIKTPVMKPLGQGNDLAKKAPPMRHSADSPSPKLQAENSSRNPNRGDEPVRPPPLRPQPMPNDSVPAFIAPRPAIKQRYVSAGGDTPLKDRPEITGFALPPAVDHGMSVGRDELLQSLSGLSSPTRHDSAIGSTRPSQDSALSPAITRTSQEIGQSAHGEKRNRTISNVSDVGSRIKRLFSRQNSSSEG